VLGDTKWVMFGKVGGIETIDFTDLRSALGLYALEIPFISTMIVTICYVISKRSRQIASLCYEFVPSARSDNAATGHSNNV
jgi:hypothetical protein